MEGYGGRPAEPNHRPVHEWRLRLAGDRVLSMQDAGEHAIGCYPQGARYAGLETGAVAPMPVLRHAPLQAARFACSS
jgi:hypothetical protein